MALSTRIEPIDRDIELMLSEELSPKAQSQVFAQFAAEQIEEAKRHNRMVLGHVPHHTVTVDGRDDAALESVRPNGVIVAEFELIIEVLQWIQEQLDTHSPVKTGNYKSQHVVFADNEMIDLGGGAVIPDADEYVFLNTAEYARKIELGSSSQAPDGVYRAVAILAAQNNRFGSLARIRFEEFRGAVAGRAGNKSKNRKPAISVKVHR